MYSVSYFNLGRLGAWFGGLSPPKLSRGDVTGTKVLPHSSKIFTVVQTQLCDFLNQQRQAKTHI